jgi:hypothetical protein
MAIYTHYDMVNDCRADRSEGWRYFVSRYAPVCRAVLEHYCSLAVRDDDVLAAALKKLRRPELPLYRKDGSGTEREFIAELRAEVLAAAGRGDGQSPPVEVDLETLSASLEGFTALERQVIWLETMQYDAPATAPLLNMEAGTVEKVRERASEALRAQMDRWQRGLIRNNAARLAPQAAAAHSDQCVPAKTYLDILDGRITWSRKQDAEAHLVQCWHCVDHFCRIREADSILNTVKPLSSGECEPFLKLLDIPVAKPPVWKRLFARG